MKTFIYEIGPVGNPLPGEEKPTRKRIQAESEEAVWKHLFPKLPFNSKTYHSYVSIEEDSGT